MYIYSLSSLRHSSRLFCIKVQSELHVLLKLLICLLTASADTVDAFVAPVLIFFSTSISGFVRR